MSTIKSDSQKWNIISALVEINILYMVESKPFS